MKNLTKVILLSAVMMFSSFSANAQKWMVEKAQTETDKVAAVLELDEEMKAKVYDIHLATYKKQKEIQLFVSKWISKEAPESSLAFTKK